ncbi:ABC transporter permease [Halobaculum sp. MBLA0147]|uniref:ABC transporter permease n=1 Tax=Halobaculum sp. MBLA0147 TaxID=3079934 RepID=UPI00352689ED
MDGPVVETLRERLRRYRRRAAAAARRVPGLRTTGGDTRTAGDNPRTTSDAASDATQSLAGRVERFTLPALAALTAALLVVVFYYPVATVFVEAVTVDGRPSLAPLVGVATDPFYLGWLGDLFADPVGTLADVFGEPGETLAAVVADPVGALLALGSLGRFGFTAWQAALSTVASVLLGLPGAWVLARFEFRGRETIRSLTIVPFILPSMLVVVGFYAAFGANGTLNTVLAVLGLARLDLLPSLPAIVLAHAFYNAPLVTRVVASAWENVDAGAVETARSLGASRRRAFRDVVAPQLLPAVLMGATLTFVFTFASFPIVLALGGARLATVEVVLYSAIRQLEYGEAAALAALESGISLALTAAYLRYERRQRTERRGGRPLSRRRLLPDGWRSAAAWTRTRLLSRAAVAGYTAIVAVVFLGPVASVLYESVVVDGQFTLRAYRFLLDRQTTGASFQVKPWPAVRNSLVFAATTLVIALPTGVAMAVVTTRSYRGSTLVDAVTMAPLAVSGVVVGLGLLRGLVFGVTAFGYRLSAAGPVAVAAAHAVAAYPFVVRNVAPALGGLDGRLVESARSLGASRVRALVDVELPLVWPGVLAGAAFALAVSVGEFDATVVLAEGSGAYTMPIAVERYVGRRLGPATAMGTVLLLVTAVSFVLVDRTGGDGW